jgi:hypothetical protein
MNNQISSQNMSKYTIKIEQLLSTDQFGDIAITIQYDAKGPKIVSIQGDQLTDQILSQVEPFFNMYNFCLTKGIPPVEISDHFMSSKSSQANKLLALILNEIKSAPATIQTINSEDVLEIDSEILRQLNN